MLRPDRPWLFRHATWFFALAVTVGTLAILLVKIDARGVLDALSHARAMPLLAAAVLSLVVKVLVGGDKWRRILTALSCPISLREATFVRTANGPLRLTPGKVGTLLAAVYLWRHQGLPFAKGVSSLLLERLQNFAVLLAFVILSPMLFHLSSHSSATPAANPGPAGQQGTSITDALPAQVDPIFSQRALLLSAACVAALGLLYAFRRPFYSLLARANLKAANVIRDLSACFHEIHPARQAGLLLYAGIAQAAEIATGYLIFQAIGVSVPFGVVFVGLSLIVVVTNIPIAVIGIGTRELAVVFLFGHYGSKPELLAIGILISAIGYALPVIAGLPLLASFIRRLTTVPAST